MLDINLSNHLFELASHNIGGNATFLESICEIYALEERLQDDDKLNEKKAIERFKAIASMTGQRQVLYLSALYSAQTWLAAAPIRTAKSYSWKVSDAMEYKLEHDQCELKEEKSLLKETEDTLFELMNITQFSNTRNTLLDMDTDSFKVFYGIYHRLRLDGINTRRIYDLDLVDYVLSIVDQVNRGYFLVAISPKAGVEIIHADEAKKRMVTDEMGFGLENDALTSLAYEVSLTDITRPTLQSIFKEAESFFDTVYNVRSETAHRYNAIAYISAGMIRMQRQDRSLQNAMSAYFHYFQANPNTSIDTLRMAKKNYFDIDGLKV
jgi:hypothetical protein